jgi:hypothetical protein
MALNLLSRMAEPEEAAEAHERATRLARLLEDEGLLLRADRAARARPPLRAPRGPRPAR